MSVAALAQVEELIDDGRPPERPGGWARSENEALGGQIIAGAARVASTTCVWLMLVAEFDRREAYDYYYGIDSTAHFLSWAAGVGRGAAREHVRVARTLTEMPLVREAFAAGQLSYSKVRECTRVVGLVDEAELVEVARGMTAAQLEAAIREFRRGRSDRVAQQHRRSLDYRIEDDGTVIVRAELPAEEAAVVLAALERAIDLDRAAHQRDGARSGDDAERADINDAPQTDVTDVTDVTDARSAKSEPEAEPVPRLSKVDALVEIARAYCEAAPSDVSGEDHDVVVVHVPAETFIEGAHPLGSPAAAVPAGTAAAATPTPEADADLAPDCPAPATGVPNGPAGTPRADAPVPRSSPVPLPLPRLVPSQAARITGLSAVTAQTAQRIACTGRIQIATLSQAGEVLNLGRTRRLVSPAQRRALMVRDRGCCQFPGCTRRRRLHAHHRIAWSRGGATDLDNLILLCQHHHTLVHEASITITRIAPSEGGGASEWRFTRIGGVPITAQQQRERNRAFRRDEDDEELLLSDLLGDLEGIEDYFDPRAEIAFPTWGGERDTRGAGRDALWHAATDTFYGHDSPGDGAADHGTDISASTIADNDEHTELPAADRTADLPAAETASSSVPAGTRFDLFGMNYIYR
ncbi:DUF222 domain-containing protein [Epidermidibacterium keratini]|uniref:DUF222 domain-containing protein n=1 Tax=Epidermidibacterium keratini TaxID=1891644 RepID=A0A7L4YRR8_9ACTN|nr:HNH endonuclease signature motif containing protein [Epidermidibacterium keratini]QHC01762.1 DUF222 domain-containing protein [Epidermidibacterium keratini]